MLMSLDEASMRATTTPSRPFKASANSSHSGNRAWDFVLSCPTLNESDRYLGLALEKPTTVSSSEASAWLKSAMRSSADPALLFSHVKMDAEF
ncbi:hypothetical protein EYF80_037107 [Liparis tanakae]|uniref:Uncharacterized protein n=1 Tax=Liparis tanakae TaxID=230148 RepID=A0A4Z2GGQ3_9TELE|nr:hypothetical protein EYF80_037107 [Liparis tanakae]